MLVAGDSFLVPVQLHPTLCVLVVLQLLHTLFTSLSLDHDAGVVVGDEAALDSSADPLQQAVVIAFDVVNDNTTGVYTQLVPSCDLHKLFHGSVTTAQSDKAATVAAVDNLASHGLLARVHVCDYSGSAEGRLVDNGFQGRTFLVVAFVFHQSFGDDAVNGIGTGQRDERLCDLAHDADGATAVYQLHVVLVESLCQFAGGSEVCGGVAARGTTAVQRVLDMALGPKKKHDVQDADDWLVRSGGRGGYCLSCLGFHFGVDCHVDVSLEGGCGCGCEGSIL